MTNIKGINMTDYVISEDELNRANGWLERYCSRCPLKTHPISDELKKERERVLNKPLTLAKFRLERITDPLIKEEYRKDMRQAIFELTMIIGTMEESLRGEP